jgi:hypothetical protein
LADQSLEQAEIIRNLSNTSQATVTIKPEIKTNGSCHDFLSANNFTATVIGAKLVKNVTYAIKDNPAYTERASSGNKFLIVTINIKNDGKIAGFTYAFHLKDFAGNRWNARAPNDIEGFGPGFTLMDLYSGKFRSGVLMYVVPEDIRDMSFCFHTGDISGQPMRGTPDGPITLCWELESCLQRS